MYQYQKWSRLLGSTVEIRQNGKTIRVGMVDQAMADDSALWLAADGVEGRALIEAAAEFEVWVKSEVFYSLK
ncbi:hypothetical protein AB0323_20250 [Arthrobacter sp. NPDC080031]|uniref:hypothetical protein n=1 Tax=Arthrobacter sp. NPDC080031 TaxID=3155918 RepID=UPI00344B84EA